MLHNYSEIVREPKSLDSESSIIDRTLTHGFSFPPHHYLYLSRGQGMEILPLGWVIWNNPVPHSYGSDWIVLKSEVNTFKTFKEHLGFMTMSIIYCISIGLL